MMAAVVAVQIVVVAGQRHEIFGARDHHIADLRELGAGVGGGLHLNIKKAAAIREKVYAQGNFMETGTPEWASLLRKLGRERGTSYRT